MNLGIILGILSIIIALILNYINLYTTYEENNKVKHWIITYYITWLIALIPIFGIIFEVAWFAFQILVFEYDCKCFLFKEV